MICLPLLTSNPNQPSSHPLDTTPNVDYFTREEIRKLVKDFKTKCSEGQLDAVSCTANSTNLL